MSIAVNIVTTSNIARRFTQTDDASIKESSKTCDVPASCFPIAT